MSSFHQKSHKGQKKRSPGNAGGGRYVTMRKNTSSQKSGEGILSWKVNTKMIKSDVRDSLPLKYQPFDNNLFTLKNYNQAVANSRNSLVDTVAAPKYPPKNDDDDDDEPSAQDISDAYINIGSFQLAKKKLSVDRSTQFDKRSESVMIASPKSWSVKYEQSDRNNNRDGGSNLFQSMKAIENFKTKYLP